MHPILLDVQVGDVSRPIGSYGACLCAALLVGGALFLRSVRGARLDIGACIAVFGCTVAGCFVGGSALFAAVTLVTTGELPPGPGLVFFGAAAGGTCALTVSARLLGVPAALVCDLAIPAVPAAHAIGRIGCLLAGCCYGRPFDGPFAVSHAGAHVHPVQLYEAGALAVLAVAFGSVSSRAGTGVRFVAYFAAYSVVRIILEFFRGDAVRGVFGPVSTSQLIGAAVFTAAAVFVVHRSPWRARSLASA